MSINSLKNGTCIICPLCLQDNLLPVFRSFQSSSAETSHVHSGIQQHWGFIAFCTPTECVFLRLTGVSIHSFLGGFVVYFWQLIWFCSKFCCHASLLATWYSGFFHFSLKVILIFLICGHAPDNSMDLYVLPYGCCSPYFLWGWGRPAHMHQLAKREVGKQYAYQKQMDIKVTPIPWGITGF